MKLIHSTRGLDIFEKPDGSVRIVMDPNVYRGMNPYDLVDRLKEQRLEAEYQAEIRAANLEEWLRGWWQRFLAGAPRLWRSR